MTDREIARYRQLRHDLRTPAMDARDLARRYCIISDEQHAAHRSALDRQLAERNARVFADTDRFAFTFEDCNR